jgi:hypothetical protein
VMEGTEAARSGKVNPIARVTLRIIAVRVTFMPNTSEV